MNRNYLGFDENVDIKFKKFLIWSVRKEFIVFLYYNIYLFINKC